MYQGQATVTAAVYYPGYDGPPVHFDVTVGGGANNTVYGPTSSSTGAQPVLESLEPYPSSTASPITLNIGSAQQLEAVLQYSNGQRINASQSSIWQSSDPSIVNVSGNGVIQAVYQGTATVTASVYASVYNTIQSFSATFSVNIPNDTSTGSSYSNPPSGVTPSGGIIADPPGNITKLPRGCPWIYPWGGSAAHPIAIPPARGRGLAPP